MSVMRITMIVHSIDGDDDRYQDASMMSFDLPDSMDRETAIQLMGGLGGHIDDELKRIDEQNEVENRELDKEAANRGTILDEAAVVDFERGLPHKRESTRGEGWPK